jgi:hypothetical protein
MVKGLTMKLLPKSSVDTYEVSLDQVVEMIAGELGVNKSQVSVEYNMAYRDSPEVPDPYVKGLIVKVNKNA